MFSHSFTAFEYVLTENDDLRKTVSEYMRPARVYTTIMSDGYGECIGLRLDRV